jgi:Flp pilus assembly protein TadB
MHWGLFMDHRHAVAYFFLLLIVAGLGAAFWRASREARARRRSSRDFERRRRERKAEQAEAAAETR